MVIAPRSTVSHVQLASLDSGPLHEDRTTTCAAAVVQPSHNLYQEGGLLSLSFATATHIWSPGVLDNRRVEAVLSVQAADENEMSNRIEKPGRVGGMSSGLKLK